MRPLPRLAFVVLLTLALAGCSRSGPPVDPTPGIYLVAADEHEPTLVAESFRATGTGATLCCPAWSPDGTLLAVAGSDGLYRMKADGSQLTRLGPGTGTAPARSPSWSPDGTRIAFLVGYYPLMYLYLIRADGSDLTRIGPSAGTLIAGEPAWSMDGTLITFEDRKGQPYQVNTDGTELEPRGPGPWQATRYMAWSPDGATLAYSEAPVIRHED